MGGGISTSALASLTVDDVVSFDFISNKIDRGFDYPRIIREHNVDGAYLSHSGIKNISVFLRSIGVENVDHVREFTTKLANARAGIGSGDRPYFPTTPSSSSAHYRATPLSPGGYNTPQPFNNLLNNGAPASRTQHPSSLIRPSNLSLAAHNRQHRDDLINEYRTLATHPPPTAYRPTWGDMQWDEQFANRGWTIVYRPSLTVTSPSSSSAPPNLSSYSSPGLPSSATPSPPLSSSPGLPFNLSQFDRALLAPSAAPPLGNATTAQLSTVQQSAIQLSTVQLSTVQPAYPSTSASTTASDSTSSDHLFPINAVTYPLTSTTFTAALPATHPTHRSESLGRPRSVHPGLWVSYVNSPKDNNSTIRGYLSPLGTNQEIYDRVAASSVSADQSTRYAPTLGETTIGTQLLAARLHLAQDKREAYDAEMLYLQTLRDLQELELDLDPVGVGNEWEARGGGGGGGGSGDGGGGSGVDRPSVLGENTITTAGHLAVLVYERYVDGGSEAMRWLQLALQRQDQAYGHDRPNHPDILLMKGWLAAMWHGVGRYHESEYNRLRGTESAVTMSRKNTLNEDPYYASLRPENAPSSSHQPHPSFIASNDDPFSLSHYESIHTSWIQAQRLYSEVARGSGLTFGPTHPSTFTARTNVAVMFDDLARVTQQRADREWHELRARYAREGYFEDYSERIESIKGLLVRALWDRREARDGYEEVARECGNGMGDGVGDRGGSRWLADRVEIQRHLVDLMEEQAHAYDLIEKVLGSGPGGGVGGAGGGAGGGGGYGSVGRYDDELRNELCRGRDGVGSRGADRGSGSGSGPGSGPGTGSGTGSGTGTGHDAYLPAYRQLVQGTRFVQECVSSGHHYLSPARHPSYARPAAYRYVDAPGTSTGMGTGTGAGAGTGAGTGSLTVAAAGSGYREPFDTRVKAIAKSGTMVDGQVRVAAQETSPGAYLDKMVQSVGTPQR